MIDLFLNVKPFPKQRPRLAKGRVYTPQETKDAEREIVYLVVDYMRKNGITISDKPLEMTISFYFKDPKITTDEDFCVDMLRTHSKKPDLDNLAKTVMDALNDLVYRDDSQICKLTCEKFYSPKEGIYLNIVEFPHGYPI